MILTSRISRLACATLAAVMVAACSSSESSSDGAAAAAPAYVAVARGRVEVQGGLLHLGAPREGTLTSVAVHESDHVSKGQVLASMDAEPATLQVQAAQAALTQAQAEVDLLKGKQVLARLQAQRLGEAAKASAGDAQSAEVAKGTVAELTARQTAADAAVGMARQKLQSARYELQLRTLRAPIDAQVITVSAQPGASVSPQSGSLFILLPQTPPIVRAELSEALVDAVKVGMPAVVSSDGGGPSQRWPAHVVRIGSVVGPSTLADDPQQRLNERTVSCVLSFDQPQHLRIGQRLLVQFGAPAAAPGAASGH